MTAPDTLIDVAAFDGPSGDGDNITDWCLGLFREHYDDPAITKDDIWEYLYGVMHAPDWRDRYKHDLARSAPRLPLAPDFEAFRAAGRELIDLHVGYETCPELDLGVLVDGQPADETHPDADTVFRVWAGGGMQWDKARDADGVPVRDDNGKMIVDHSALRVNERCSLVGVPDEARAYKVSGRSPLEWAIDQLKINTPDKKAGIVKDCNHWPEWADEPFNLIRHLRRLAYVGVETHRIVEGLPPSLDDDTAPATQPEKAAA